MLPRTRATSATVAVLLVAGASFAVASPAAPVRRGSGNVVTAAPSLNTQIAAGINAARVATGLVRLRLSPALGRAAASHSFEMARHGYFAHRSADGSSPWKRLARYYPSSGYTDWEVGETLLWSSPGTTAADTVEEWLTSPEHRAILLDPAFRELGVAAVHATSAGGEFGGDAVTIVTADFGARAR